MRWLMSGCLFLAVVAPAFADPEPMAIGGLPEPTDDTQVALAEERLDIDVHAKDAGVYALLVFENRGETPAKLAVGFPCNAKEPMGVAGLDCSTKIKVAVNGKRVAAKLKKTKGGKHWMWTVTFPAQEKVEMAISYKARLHNDRYSVPLAGMGTLYYRLGTGARWAGPIDKLAMKVTIPTDAILHITPAGYTRTPGKIVWELEGVEPKEDLAILLNPYWIARDKQKDAAKEFLAEMKEHLEYAAFFQKAVRAELGLPDPKPAEVEATVKESAKLMAEPRP